MSSTDSDTPLYDGCSDSLQETLKAQGSLSTSDEALSTEEAEIATQQCVDLASPFSSRANSVIDLRRGTLTRPTTPTTAHEAPPQSTHTCEHDDDDDDDLFSEDEEDTCSICLDRFVTRSPTQPDHASQ